VLFFGILSSPKNNCANEGVRRSARNHKIWNYRTRNSGFVTVIYHKATYYSNSRSLKDRWHRSGEDCNSNLYVPDKHFLKCLFSHMYCLHRGLHRSGENCTTCYVLVTYCFSRFHFNDHRLTRICMAISDPATDLKIVGLPNPLQFSLISVLRMPSKIFLTLGNGASFPEDKKTGTHLRPVPSSRTTRNLTPLNHTLWWSA